MDFETRVSTIYREALRTPRELRFAYLDSACGSDQKLHNFVETLLDATDGRPVSGDEQTIALAPADPAQAGSSPVSMLAGAATAPARARIDATADVWSEIRPGAHSGRRSRILYTEDLSGERIGQYELLHRIGKGGMGTVYAACRADQEYRKLVAVKLVKPGMESHEILQRFKHERQVLANLDHPNIARLLDGGTEHGTPYLVMEYVEGTAFDTYIQNRRLTLHDKINLFVTVCSAVQYAHQSLVVHRDIKPANIMVSNDGIPKLLDFGIAKVLGPDPFDLPAMTQASERPMTPDYASPEQVRGEQITTASDVYALGVLLYELLTTVHPLRAWYKTVGHFRAVTETIPERPSDTVKKLPPGRMSEPDRNKLALALRGDLDSIVLMCLRKEPNRRYASVQHLIDDLHRYLTGMPVRAHADSASYRVRKFVTRHKRGVAAGALAAIALIASSMISWAYYHRANIEKKRAEARFDDVRQFSRYVLFDFDNVLNSGITPARNALLEKATEYLGRLEKDKGRDSSIEQELVQSYLKIGDSRGNQTKPNLGDRQAARRNYEKALALVQQSSHPRSVLLAETQLRIADLTTQDRSFKDAIPIYELAISAVEKDVAKKDVEACTILINALQKLGFARNQAGMPDRAIQSYDRSLGVIQDLKSLGKDTPELRGLAARSELRRGETRATLGHTEEGLAAMLRAVGTYEALAAASPNSASAQRAIATSSGVVGDVLRRVRRPNEAAEAYRRSLRVVEDLAATDPKNAQYHRDICTFLSRLGEALTDAGRLTEAKAATRRVLDLLRPLTMQPDAGVYDLHQYAWTLLTTPHSDLRNSAEALRAAELLVAVTKRSDPSRLDVLARAYGASGLYKRAAETEQEALSLLPPGTTSDLREELTRQLRLFQSKR